jgi:hypothetical protein
MFSRGLSLRPNYAIQIRNLPADRLEALVDEWLTYRQREYHSHERWSGPGDMGRDVVGYVTPARHEGEWDNFQCKQLGKTLTELPLLLELAKIFMHSSNGAFSLPRAFYFVAPTGIGRDAKSLLAHPSRLRQTCIDRWDSDLAKKLVENATVPLAPAIRSTIGQFNFTRVYGLDSIVLENDPSMLPVLVKWFGADPGEAPRGKTPDEFDAREARYISQLVQIYSTQAGTTFADAREVLQDTKWAANLRLQRTRFFEAAEFERFYRDSTPPEFLVNFREDIHSGVVDAYHDDQHKNEFDRLNKVMGQAATIQVSGVLAKYARVPVKQGTCHHLANDGSMPWTA